MLRTRIVKAVGSAFLLAAASCSRHAPVSPVVGTWTEDSAEPFQFEFRPDGTFQASVSRPSIAFAVTSTGRYRLAGNRLWTYDQHYEIRKRGKVTSNPSDSYQVDGYYVTLGKDWIRLDSIQLHRGVGPWKPVPPTPPASVVGSWLMDSVRKDEGWEFKRDGTFVRRVQMGNPKGEVMTVGRYQQMGARLRMFDEHYAMSNGDVKLEESDAWHSSRRVGGDEMARLNSLDGCISIDGVYFHRQ